MAIDEYTGRAPATRDTDAVHLDAAGCALMADQTVDAQLASLTAERVHAVTAETKIKARASVARLINADPREIAILPSGSLAWFQALTSIPIRAGQTILVSSSEFFVNYIALLRYAKNRPLALQRIPDDHYGRSSSEQLTKILGSHVGLVCVTHMSNNSGSLNPIHEIAKICRTRNVPLLVDACQTVGQVPLDMKEIFCDYLVGTGRKFLRAPRGTAFLYAKKTSLTNWPTIIDYPTARLDQSLAPMTRVSDAAIYELGEQNLVALAGLKAAADSAMELDSTVIWRQINDISLLVRDCLRSLPLILHEHGPESGAIVTFHSKEIDSQEIISRLADRHIFVGSARRRSTPLDQCSNERDLVRISPHYYNTREEIMNLHEELGRILYRF
ncbi:aminotransferase class V-fold PLP-dependent enzyme [Amycolatopsis sp. NPDC088138]|uniref:aminotransferase class V-fold PLP-dependent enzyme n=1 Tax=Amycolatopsis sp. NPDC088138 TaxID=3363938 RepID=UPI00380CF356